MSYRHIENLYKNKEVLLFKQCYAMEKIHGTSANVHYNQETDHLSFISGGSKHESFVTFFDQENLLEAFRQNKVEHPEVKNITIWGEAYGGKLQGMSKTYGPALKFVAFEVCVDDQWFAVKQADFFVQKFGLEFVHYEVIDTTEEAINTAMMADSVQAVRNGMGAGHMREGVVLRPLIELVHPNGGRIICKHKRSEFAERETTPSFTDPEELKILEDAGAIAEEWCTMMRLHHVLDMMTNPQMEDAQKIIKAMLADIEREASGEILESKASRKEIGKKTMKLFKEFLMSNTYTGPSNV